MKRKAVVRHVTLGALATSLVPLTALGAGAGQHDGSAAGLCRAAFGDRGPAEGPVVGEGPSGDSMVVTVGWDPEDWSGDIGRIVTCVSVDGRAIPELATSTVEPPNTGGLVLDLTLPAGEPGALVCEQSVLVGEGDTPGRTPPTSPECFKLRAADPPPPTKSAGRTSGDAPAPSGPSASGPAPAGPAVPGSDVARRLGAPPGPAGPPGPVGPPASTARKAAGSRAGRSPAPDPASTPPGRAASEAAAGPVATPTARTTAPAAPVRTAAAAGTAAGAAPAASPPATVAADAATPALARTGLENQIPLAGAGLLLALGGAGIMFGEPRRRAWNTRPA